MAGWPEGGHMRRQVKHGIWLVLALVLLGSAFPGIVWADADLVMAKDANDLFPALYQDIVFTIQVQNNGPDNTTNVAVTDNLPSGLVYVTHSTTQGSFNPATGIWSVGTLNNGTSAIMYMTVSVETYLSVTNIAYVSATDVADPTPASASVTINASSGSGTTVSTGCGIDASSN